jgi:uncharacterized protein YndB with AHSA1/START domain
MRSIPVADAIGAVTREVETIEREGKPARVVVATRVYDTDIEDCWDALTSAERIPRWFLPISGELRLGGRYQLEGNAGGTITTCERPRHLAVTWEMMGQVSWVTVRLEAVEPERTRLRLEHTAHVDDAFWDQFGPGAVGVGWDLGLLGLGEHLATGQAVALEAAQGWASSDEGKRYHAQASEAWAQASIAAGTDPAQAKAAAERTTAFYTGGP